MLLAWIFTVVLTVLLERLLAFTLKALLFHRLTFAAPVNLFSKTRTLPLVSIRIISLRLGACEHFLKLVTEGFIFCFTLITTHALRVLKALQPYNILLLRITLIFTIYSNLDWEDTYMATTFTITDSLEEPILFDNTYATRYEIEVDVWPFGTSDDYFDGAVVTYFAKDGTQLATASYDKSESDLAYADFPWLLDRVYQEGLESLQEVADDRRSGWHNYEGLTDE